MYGVCQVCTKEAEIPGCPGRGMASVVINPAWIDTYTLKELPGKPVERRLARRDK